MSTPRSVFRAELDLPSVPRSASAARHVVTQLLAAWAADGYRDDAALLVSELVTNVVRHVPAGTPMTVEVRLTRTALHVAVVDDSAVPAATRPRTAQGGHGLWLVAAVADDWGSEEHVKELETDSHGSSLLRTWRRPGCQGERVRAYRVRRRALRGRCVAGRSLNGHIIHV